MTFARGLAGGLCISLLQMCLAPIWKAYEVLDAGTDVAAVLSRMITKLDLTQVSDPMNKLTQFASR